MGQNIANGTILTWCNISIWKSCVLLTFPLITTATPTRVHVAITARRGMSVGLSSAFIVLGSSKSKHIRRMWLSSLYFSSFSPSVVSSRRRRESFGCRSSSRGSQTISWWISRYPRILVISLKLPWQCNAYGCVKPCRMAPTQSLRSILFVLFWEQVRTI